MNARTILFPTDFSEASRDAFLYASSLARDTGAKLLIIHVEEPVVPYMGEEMYVPRKAVVNPELEKMLAEVVPADEAVPYEHMVLAGSPATELLRIAKERGADFIVLGTHGRTGISRLLVGSVAEEVLRRAECPVLTVKSSASARNQKPTAPAVAR